MSNQIYSAHQPNDVTRSLIENLCDENGDTIVKINPENNLVHLTSMCQKGGKLAKDYLRLERTKALIEAFEQEGEGPLAIEVVHGGSNPGTWVHPDIAVDAAMWISPRFGLAVARLVRSFLTGHVTTEQSQAAARQMQQAVQTVSPEDHQHRMALLKQKDRELDQEDRKFAERMMVRSEEFEDILLKQALRDYAANFFATQGSDEPKETYIDVPEILKQVGIPQKESGRHGRAIARQFREHFGREPKKALKVVNGSQRECKVYNMQEVETIKTWL